MIGPYFVPIFFAFSFLFCQYKFGSKLCQWHRVSTTQVDLATKTSSFSDVIAWGPLTFKAFLVPKSLFMGKGQEPTKTKMIYFAKPIFEDPNRPTHHGGINQTPLPWASLEYSSEQPNIPKHYQKKIGTPKLPWLHPPKNPKNQKDLKQIQ